MLNLKTERRFTTAEKKRLKEILDKTKDKKKAYTVQQSIPYMAMHPNGICQIDDTTFSKTVRFEDINYRLASADEKNELFEKWREFLNYFDSSVRVQFSFINQNRRKNDSEQIPMIPHKDYRFESIINEYSQMLKTQHEKGNNGIKKERYITFTVNADQFISAKKQLERIENDILNSFKNIGVPAQSMTGYDRLQTLHEIFHPNGEEFMFSWSWLPSAGLHSKDIIAPASFKFSDGRTFMMDDKTGAVSFLQILASEISDKMLSEFIDTEHPQIVNLHIQSIDQREAVKLIKHKITDLDKMKIDEQKKAIRSGYDIDILPSDLMTYGIDAKNLLEDLQNRNERLFLITLLFCNIADNQRQLKNQIFSLSGIAQKYNCAVTRLDYQQEEGLMSSLPLGLNRIEIKRGLTTSSTAIFMPFMTSELFQSGEALYYGLNTLSGNMILCDRKKLKNPNGLILGTPGSGKSFAAKREMTNAFFVTDDDIIICDHESEYRSLTERLDGQVITLSPDSTQYVNPMDINPNYSEDDNPIALKADFILSLCELIIGGKEGLKPIERTIIDRATANIYNEFLSKYSYNGETDSEHMPILEDLYNEILRQPEAQAKHIAASLELYVKGSLNMFNHRTNVKLNNRMVCYDIKQLGKQLKKLGMLIIQDQTWNRVTLNRSLKKSTRFYLDEMHLLLKEEETAAYTVEIWKRFRKWGGIPTGITQNTKDLLASREIENIIENSDFILMLNQAAGDREILARRLNISPQQMKYVTQSEMGTGLLFYGNLLLPFSDKFPRDTELYGIMTTRPEEMR